VKIVIIPTNQQFKKTQTMMKFNVVQERGTLKKQAIPK
jgi:hypothetical protein